MKGALHREWNLSLQCFLYVPQFFSQIARTFNRFLEASHTPWRRRRAEWPWTIILPPLSFHVLALHKSLSIQHFSSQTTHSIKQQIRAKRAMEEIEIVYFLLIFRGVTAVVYLYQLCSLRSRTIKSERDCSDYAMSGQHLVSVIIDTVLCYLLLHCDCQMSVRDTALRRGHQGISSAR